MPAWWHDLTVWLAVPEQGLAALAVAAFIAASVFPFASEAVLVGVVAARPDAWGPALLVATLANTAGSLTTYALGRLGRRLPNADHLQRYEQRLRRMGPGLLLLAWVPVVGDVIVLVAGWVRLGVWRTTAYIATGKALRYAAVLVLWARLAH